MVRVLPAFPSGLRQNSAFSHFAVNSGKSALHCLLYAPAERDEARHTWRGRFFALAGPSPLWNFRSPPLPPTRN